MSLFPSPVLVRLQELKLWQGNYDSLVQNKSKEGTNPSDFETIEGLSRLDSSRSTPSTSPVRGNPIDWDKKPITPSKPFEQLLEEKLALDSPFSVQAKPKRPFLKKGTGLLRYKLGEDAAQKKKGLQDKAPAEQPGQDKQLKNRRLCKSYSRISAPLRNGLRSHRMTNEQKENVFADSNPSKTPDLTLPPKATWRTVLEDDNFNQKGHTEIQYDKCDEDLNSYKNKFNSHIIGKINDFNFKRVIPGSPRRSILSKKYSESISTIPESESERSDPQNDLSTESELRIFEALEERVENSSFSSTNSSILRLLSSTPNKAKPKNDDKEEYHFKGIQNALLQKKLHEVNQRTDVLQDFLKNLRKIGNNDRRATNSIESAQDRSADTSFSDEEKWSSDTDVSRPPSTTYTDTVTFNDPSKTDVAVNTSFEDKDECVQFNEKCSNCDELKTKLEEVSKQLPDIQAEKARVCDFAKELEAKRDQLCRDMEMMKLKHESVMSDLKQELESEKRRFAKEKMTFDIYVKESQNRPRKKDREEIYELQKELMDAKELMKLKETKNGATQARLRTQVKQLQKENSELKQEVEKLQRENAKMSATQLVRRPSEVKMLHEINKNLTKLTEETLRKQQSTADTSWNPPTPKEVKKLPARKPKVPEDRGDNVILPKGKRIILSQHKVGENDDKFSNSDDSSKFEMTTFADIYLEKQYENAFAEGCRTSDNTMDDSKKERSETIFEDGSKEIKYSNGNTKTISPDGNLTILKYYNGDIKETNLADNTLKYYYAESAIWHMHYADGSEMLEYPSGQREKTYPDRRKEVYCEDGSVTFVDPEGTEETIYTDGSKLIKSLNGEKILVLPNGQREVHTRDHKRREYPDGTVKILYPDGSQETRYASGRIRIKDGNGVLIMDTQNPP